MRIGAILLALATIGAADVPDGTRFGLYVATLDGREIASLRADERFVPASTTKIFTTITAFETLAVDLPDAAGGVVR